MRLTGDQVELHVVVRYGQPIQVVADDIAEALSPLLGGRVLKIMVDDLVLPGEDLSDEMITNRLERSASAGDEPPPT